MAKFRMVHTAFWDDSKVNEKMTPEDRYFFLYLLTNGSTTEVGIYQITKEQMACEMGYSIESIHSLVQRFTDHYKLIKYSEQTCEMAIRNWGRYHFNEGGKLVMDCIQAELKLVKELSLIQFVAERIEKPEIKTMYTMYYDSLYDTSMKRGQKQQEQNRASRSYFQYKNVSSFYQNNFGVESPFITDKLTHAINEFGEVIVMEAMKKTLSGNKRNWNYVNGILKKWRDHKVKTLGDIKALDIEIENSRSQSSGHRGSTRVENPPAWFGKSEMAEQPNEIDADFEREKQELLALLQKRERKINKLG